MDKQCIVCLENFCGVPYLTCGHFVCPCCYCELKNRHKNGCPYCHQRMIRGKRHKLKK